MQNEIPDLWPEEIGAGNVLTPLAIMRVQASQLRHKTKGLVEAEINVTRQGEDEHYQFDLIAPALDRYRYRLFTAQHRTKQVYPITVFVDWWDQPSECDTPPQFVHALSNIFNASPTKSLVLSILAQSNEHRAQASDASGRQPNADKPSDDE